MHWKEWYNKHHIKCIHNGSQTRLYQFPKKQHHSPFTQSWNFTHPSSINEAIYYTLKAKIIIHTFNNTLKPNKLIKCQIQKIQIHFTSSEGKGDGDGMDDFSIDRGGISSSDSLNSWCALDMSGTYKTCYTTY